MVSLFSYTTADRQLLLTALLGLLLAVMVVEAAPSSCTFVPLSRHYSVTLSGLTLPMTSVPADHIQKLDWFDVTVESNDLCAELKITAKKPVGNSSEAVVKTMPFEGFSGTEESGAWSVKYKESGAFSILQLSCDMDKTVDAAMSDFTVNHNDQSFISSGGKLLSSRFCYRTYSITQSHNPTASHQATLSHEPTASPQPTGTHTFPPTPSAEATATKTDSKTASRSKSESSTGAKSLTVSLEATASEPLSGTKSVTATVSLVATPSQPLSTSKSLTLTAEVTESKEITSSSSTSLSVSEPLRPSNETLSGSLLLNATLLPWVAAEIGILGTTVAEIPTAAHLVHPVTCPPSPTTGESNRCYTMLQVSDDDPVAVVMGINGSDISLRSRTFSASTKAIGAVLNPKTMYGFGTEHLLVLSNEDVHLVDLTSSALSDTWKYSFSKSCGGSAALLRSKSLLTSTNVFALQCPTSSSQLHVFTLGTVAVQGYTALAPRTVQSAKGFSPIVEDGADGAFSLGWWDGSVVVLPFFVGSEGAAILEPMSVDTGSLYENDLAAPKPVPLVSRHGKKQVLAIVGEKDIVAFGYSKLVVADRRWYFTPSTSSRITATASWHHLIFVGSGRHLQAIESRSGAIELDIQLNATINNIQVLPETIDGQQTLQVVSTLLSGDVVTCVVSVLPDTLSSPPICRAIFTDKVMGPLIGTSPISTTLASQLFRSSDRMFWIQGLSQAHLVRSPLVKTSGATPEFESSPSIVMSVAVDASLIESPPQLLSSTTVLAFDNTLDDIVRGVSSPSADTELDKRFETVEGLFNPWNGKPTAQVFVGLTWTAGRIPALGGYDPISKSMMGTSPFNLPTSVEDFDTCDSDFLFGPFPTEGNASRVLAACVSTKHRNLWAFEWPAGNTPVLVHQGIAAKTPKDISVQAASSGAENTWFSIRDGKELLLSRIQSAVQKTVTKRVAEVSEAPEKMLTGLLNAVPVVALKFKTSFALGWSALDGDAGVSMFSLPKSLSNSSAFNLHTSVSGILLLSTTVCAKDNICMGYLRPRSWIPGEASDAPRFTSLVPVITRELLPPIPSKDLDTSHIIQYHAGYFGKRVFVHGAALGTDRVDDEYVAAFDLIGDSQSTPLPPRRRWFKASLGSGSRPKVDQNAPLHVLATNWSVIVATGVDKIVSLDAVDGSFLASTSTATARAFVDNSATVWHPRGDPSFAAAPELFRSNGILAWLEDSMGHLTATILSLPSLELVFAVSVGYTKQGVVATFGASPEPENPADEKLTAVSILRGGFSSHAEAFSAVSFNLEAVIGAKELTSRVMQFETNEFEISHAVSELFCLVNTIPSEWRAYRDIRTWGSGVTYSEEQHSVGISATPATLGGKPLKGTLNFAAFSNPLLNLTELSLPGQHLNASRVVFPPGAAFDTLQVFNVSSNAFYGRLDITQIPPSVRLFDISRNVKMKMSWAAKDVAWQKQSQLVDLRAAEVLFVEELPSDFMSVIPFSLKTVNFMDSGLTGNAADILVVGDFNASKLSLRNLILDGNDLSGDISAVTGDRLPPSLEVLQLSGNHDIKGEVNLHRGVDGEAPSQLTRLDLSGTRMDGLLNLTDTAPTLSMMNLAYTKVGGAVDVTPLQHTHSRYQMLAGYDAQSDTETFDEKSTRASLVLILTGTEVLTLFSESCPPSDASGVTVAYNKTRMECIIDTGNEVVVSTEDRCARDPDTGHPWLMYSVAGSDVLNIVNMSDSVMNTKCQIPKYYFRVINTGQLVFGSSMAERLHPCLDPSGEPPGSTHRWSINVTSNVLIIEIPDRGTFVFSSRVCSPFQEAGAYCANSYMSPGVWFRLNITLHNVTMIRIDTLSTVPKESICTYHAPLYVVNNTDSPHPYFFPTAQGGAFEALKNCSPTTGFKAFTRLEVIDVNETIELVDEDQRTLPLHTKICSDTNFPSRSECTALPGLPPSGRSDTCYEGYCGEVRSVTWESCDSSRWLSGFHREDQCRPLSDLIPGSALRTGADTFDNDVPCGFGRFSNCLLTNTSSASSNTDNNKDMGDCNLALGKYAGLITCRLLQEKDVKSAVSNLLSQYCPNAVLNGHQIPRGKCAGSPEEQEKLCALLMYFMRPISDIKVRARCENRGDFVTFESCDTRYVMPVARLPTDTCLARSVAFRCSPCSPYIEPTAHALPYTLLFFSTCKDILLVLFGAMVLERSAIKRRTTKFFVAILIAMMPYRGREKAEWKKHWHRRLNPTPVKENAFRSCFERLMSKARKHIVTNDPSGENHPSLAKRISDKLEKEAGSSVYSPREDAGSVAASDDRASTRSTLREPLLGTDGRKSPREHGSFGGRKSLTNTPLLLAQTHSQYQSVLSMATLGRSQFSFDSDTFDALDDEDFYGWFISYVTLSRTQLLTDESLDDDRVVEAFARLYDSYARYVDFVEPRMTLVNAPSTAGFGNGRTALDEGSDDGYVHIDMPPLNLQNLRVSQALSHNPSEAGDNFTSVSQNNNGNGNLQDSSQETFNVDDFGLKLKHADVTEGLDLEFALLVFQRRAHFREVMLELTQLDKRFTPQAWMLMLEIFYAVIFLLVCFVESGKNTYTAWDSFTAMYFRFVNSCSSVSLITNSVLRRLYRYKQDGYMDFFLLTAIILLAPALLHIVPGMILYGWLTFLVAFPLAPICYLLKVYEDRHVSEVNVISVGIRVTFRFLLTFMVTLILQTSFNYAVLFYERKNLELSYLEIITYEFNSRKWECFIINALESLTSFLQLMSVAI